ncbi:MAG: FKBP-type peptidyl-prolyl cis-trans isomerase [Candidatus Paceibacterota bacterium]|jgi:FKBP-type peptidyl-prolyl cis-trans isomerase
MKNQKENIGVVVSFIVVACVVGLVIYILMNKKVDVDSKSDNKNRITENQNTNQTKNETDATKEESNTPTNKMETNSKILNDFTPVSKVSKLEKIDLVVGSGEEVKTGATVSVHYVGAIAATGDIFQSSKDFGPTPVTFPLSGVIKGWTDGIPGMKVGGTRRLMIPADQAYGANPPGGSGIPANADLVFDVELKAIN